MSRKADFDRFSVSFPRYGFVLDVAGGAAHRDQIAPGDIYLRAAATPADAASGLAHDRADQILQEYFRSKHCPEPLCGPSPERLEAERWTSDYELKLNKMHPVKGSYEPLVNASGLFRE